jgi:nitrogen fixation/metabolism regulation signal transduction histidine kinase
MVASANTGCVTGGHPAGREVATFRSGDAVAVIDSRLRVQSWNAAAESLTGVAAGAAVGRHCWQVLGGRPEDGAAVCHAGCVLALRALQGGEVSHSRATHVQVRLHRDDHHAVLDVRDDGAGFDAARPPNAGRAGHVGLRVLRDLVEDAGGRVEIASSPGAGTHVRVEVPTR